MAAVLAGLLTTWVTFVPCFLFVLLGAPYVERLRGNPGLSAALTGVTAAVVGVIADLALQVSALALTVVGFALIFALRWSVLRTRGVCALAGIALHLVSAALH